MKEHILATENSDDGAAGSLTEHEKNSHSIGRLLKIMKEGEYFGEIALMTNLKRTTTVKAKEFSTLGFLSKKVFQNARIEYP